MPYDVFVAMFIFAAVTAFTPGPNNIMVTASGVNFGFMRTIPHMAGILIGFVVLLAACGAGLGLLFNAYAPLQFLLKLLGAAYMLFLAWKVAHARPADDEAKSSARPLTFLEAAAFQWVNPKAWVIAVSAIAIYIRPDHWTLDFAIMLAVFGFFTVATITFWTGFGVALRSLLKNPRHARIFNVTMAFLLVASIVPMVI